MVEITCEYLAASGTEDGHQAALFLYATDPRYASARGDTDWIWHMLYAIPNGGKRSISTAARLKATGVKAGFPDIGLAVARGGFHGLFIEMKKPKSDKYQKGSTRAKQTDWHANLRTCGYYVEVCYGWIDAIATVHAYLEWKILTR